jgi:hypothetical protein
MGNDVVAALNLYLALCLKAISDAMFVPGSGNVACK